MRVNDVWVRRSSIWRGDRSTTAVLISLEIDEECAKELINILHHKAEGLLASKKWTEVTEILKSISELTSAMDELKKEEEKLNAEELDRIENELFPPRKAPEA